MGMPFHSGWVLCCCNQSFCLSLHLPLFQLPKSVVSYQWSHPLVMKGYTMDVAREAVDNFRLYASRAVAMLDLEQDYQMKEVEVKQESQGSVLKPLKLLSFGKMSYSKMTVNFEMPKDTTQFNTLVGLKNLKNSPVMVKQYFPERNVPDAKSWYGVVIEVKSKLLIVQFEEEFSLLEDESLFSLRVHSDDKEFKKTRDVLRAMLEHPDPVTNLLAIRFGTKSIRTTEIIRELNLFNLNLNQVQQDAVRFALSVENLGIIHGPPGTGKTTVVVEIVRQVVKNGGRVLVCTPTNVALDNVVEKLVGHGIKVTRIGNLARLSNKELVRHTLDAMVADLPEIVQITEVKAELAKVVNLLSHCKKFNRKRLTKEANFLRHHLTFRQSVANEDILKTSNVICSTIMSSFFDGILKPLAETSFDMVIIDESSQCTEPQSYIPMMWSTKIILAGDHQQLSPMVMSPRAQDLGLGVSFMEQVTYLRGGEVTFMLTHQYRMNKKIMNWISKNFYNGRLVADPSVANKVLTDLEDVEETPLTSNCLVFVDTSGCKIEDSVSSTNSYENVGEAEVAVNIIKNLLEAGVQPGNIGVVTPYKAQVNLLMDLLQKENICQELEVRTVDGFQGREKEAIIFSYVRSNPQKATGFVSDSRRTNVAMSRAKKLLCVIGDSMTLSVDPLISDLIKYIKKEGLVQSGFEYLNCFFVPKPKNVSITSIAKKSKKKKSSSSTAFPDQELPKYQDFLNMPDEDEIHPSSSGISTHKASFIDINKYLILDDEDEIHPSSNGVDMCKYLNVQDKDGIHPSNNENDIAKYFHMQDKDEIHPSNSGLDTNNINHFDMYKYFNGNNADKIHPSSSVISTQRVGCTGTDKYASDVGHTGSLEGAFAVPSYQELGAAAAGISYGEMGAAVPGISYEVMGAVALGTSYEGMGAVAVGTSYEGMGALALGTSYSGMGAVALGTSYPGMEAATSGTSYQQWGQDTGSTVASTFAPYGFSMGFAGGSQTTTASNQTSQPKVGGKCDVVKASKNVTRSKGKQKQGTNTVDTKSSEDVDDAIIEQFAHLNHQCAMVSCRERVGTVFHDCQLCKKRFCIPHTLPEVHGCGADAKKEARKKFVHPPPQPVDESKRKQLEKKLNSRLGTLSSMRKGGNSKDGKKS